MLKEEPGDAVAHFKFTVLLLRNGTKQITLSAPAIDWANVKSDKKLDPESQAHVDAHFGAIAEAEAKKAAAKAKKKAAAAAKKAKKKAAAAGGAE